MVRELVLPSPHKHWGAFTAPYAGRKKTKRRGREREREREREKKTNEKKSPIGTAVLAPSKFKAEQRESPIAEVFCAVLELSTKATAGDMTWFCGTCPEPCTLTLAFDLEGFFGGNAYVHTGRALP